MSQASIKIHPIGSPTPIKKEVGQLSVDIYHTDKEIVVLAPIAGVEKDKIKISLTEEVLHIEGERKAKEEVSEEKYYTQECFWGPFARSIVLPKEADIKGISASFDNHVLEIRIPKSDVGKTQIIKIKA